MKKITGLIFCIFLCSCNQKTESNSPVVTSTSPPPAVTKPVKPTWEIYTSTDKLTGEKTEQLFYEEKLDMPNYPKATITIAITIKSEIREDYAKNTKYNDCKMHEEVTVYDSPNLLTITEQFPTLLTEVRQLNYKGANYTNRYRVGKFNNVYEFDYAKYKWNANFNSLPKKSEFKFSNGATIVIDYEGANTAYLDSKKCSYS